MSSLWQYLHEKTSEFHYRFGTHRAVAPSKTLQRIKPLLPRAGITRLADVTGLDWLGIPVYQAIRPNSRNMSVSQGKGVTREQAKVSALMESLEFFHAEEVAQPTVCTTVGEMRRSINYDPYILLRPRHGFLSDDTYVDWVAATNLRTGADTWIPKQLCEFNACVVERLSVKQFLSASNGLASGNTFTEAVIHALCEVIERDAVWRNLETRFDAEHAIKPTSIFPHLARQLMDRFRRAGMQIHISDATGPTRLPCFEVFLDCPDIPHLLFYGAGCHQRASIALLRAFTEVAQSRVTHIAGSRDDLKSRNYSKKGQLLNFREGPAWPTEPHRDFRSIPQLSLGGALSTLQDIVDRVYLMTGMEPMAIDLSKPDFGLPVVYVVAPGLRVSHYERVQR